jgi:hypothetical protein
MDGKSTTDRFYRTLWEWFFFDQGFVRDKANKPDESGESRLVYQFAPTN